MTGRISPKRGDEGAVDLHHVDGESREVAEGGVPGPEVVEGKLHPECLEVIEHEYGAFAVADKDALGDLQGQEPWVGGGLTEHGLDALGEARGHQLARGYVDGNGDVIHPVALPALTVCQSPLKHPPAELDDLAGVLDKRYQHRRGDQPAPRVLPAQKRLDRRQLSVAGADDRLVHDVQLATLRRSEQRLLQVGLIVGEMQVAQIDASV